MFDPTSEADWAKADSAAYAEETYHEIAVELGDPSTTLDDLDPEFVAEAATWAATNHMPWPPAPETEWEITVYSL